MYMLNFNLMGETSINNGVYNKNCASKYRDD